MRRIFSFLKYFLFFILLIAGLTYISLSTQVGTQTAVKLIARVVPGTLKIKHINGSLDSNVIFSNISFSNENVQLQIKSLSVRWHPYQLLNKKFVFDSINATGIHCELTTNSKNKLATHESTSLQDSLSLLSSIIIKHLNIKNLIVSQDKTILYRFNQLTLSRQPDDSQHFNLQSADGDLWGQFTFVASPNLGWHVLVTGKDVNPKAFVSGPGHGKINFVLKSAGIWTSKEKKINLNIEGIDGTLEQFPVTGFVAAYFDNGKLKIQPSQLKIGEAVAKLSGTLHNDWNLDWQLNIPQLETIIANSKGYITSSGKVIGPEQNPTIQANVSARDVTYQNIKIKNMQGEISSRLKTLQPSSAKLSLRIKDLAASDYHIPEMELKIDSEIVNEKLISKLLLAMNAANQIKGNVTLPSFKASADLDQPVEGNLDVNFTRLSEMFSSTEIKDLKGRLQGSIDISGKLSNPTLIAKANIEDGHVFINRLRIALEAINLQGNYRSHQPVNLSGSFVSGKGRGELVGKVDLHKPGLPLTIKLNGSNLTVMNSNEYKVVVSPDLDFSYVDQKANIQGQVVIPFAEIKPKDFSSVTTLPSETVVIANEKQEDQTNYPTNFVMNVKIILGDHIFLAYQNIKAKLVGNVVITQHLASLPTASGELRAVDGTYQAYGKNMTIQAGRLIYTGNVLTNPGLDIRAIQQFKQLAIENGESKFNDTTGLEPVYMGSSNTLTVGIWVKGTLNKPDISFFSDPAGLSQSDILSYLVLGYPRSQIKSANKLAVLNSIASGLYQSEGNVGGVTQKVQKVFGLSELSVGSTDYFDPKKNAAESATTVSVGKKIGHNLSLHYSVGLFSSISIFNLRYQINKRLAIQSETSSMDTGADLVYEVEKD